MNPAALLLLLFSNQAYWVSGLEESVNVRWVASEQMPAADLVWQLGFGPVRLVGGSIPVVGGDAPATIAVKVPAVRVRATLIWSYRLVQRDGHKLLESGERPIHVFPANLMQDWPNRLRANGESSIPASKSLVIWDDAAGLPKAFEAAKVPFVRVDNLDKILDRPDMIVVSADRIDDSAFAQGPIVNFARAGSSVAVLEQPRPDYLAGYALATRVPPARIRFKSDHPLFARFTDEDLQSWVSGVARPWRAVQLPPDEPALELAWWERELADDRPVPIDALLVIRTIGAGRIVLCQVPLGPLGQDPRSQIFMGNLLSYLATRPEPTISPSERHEVRPPARMAVPTVIVPSGTRS